MGATLTGLHCTTTHPTLNIHVSETVCDDFPIDLLSACNVNRLNYARLTSINN